MPCGHAVEGTGYGVIGTDHIEKVPLSTVPCAFWEVQIEEDEDIPKFEAIKPGTERLR